MESYPALWQRCLHRYNSKTHITVTVLPFSVTEWYISQKGQALAEVENGDFENYFDLDGNEIFVEGTNASDTSTSNYQSEDIPYLIIKHCSASPLWPVPLSPEWYDAMNQIMNVGVTRTDEDNSQWFDKKLTMTWC